MDIYSIIKHETPRGWSCIYIKTLQISLITNKCTILRVKIVTIENTLYIGYGNQIIIYDIKSEPEREIYTYYFDNIIISGMRVTDKTSDLIYIAGRHPFDRYNCIKIFNTVTLTHKDHI